VSGVISAVISKSCAAEPNMNAAAAECRRERRASK
jgi:hypothetical protein